MENKSLFKNTIYNALYNGLNIIFPLITIPYLSRILLSDGLGLVNYSRSIVSWFLIFASLGIPRYGVREIAKIKDNRNKLNKTFTELFLYNLLSTCICAVIYMLVISDVSLFSNHYLLYMVTGIQLFISSIRRIRLYNKKKFCCESNFIIMHVYICEGKTRLYHLCTDTKFGCCRKLCV